MAASLSDGQQNSLITEFKSNTKTSWRQVMTKVTRDNQPHSHLTKQQFEEGLPLQTQSLIDALWNEIKALDDQQNDETLPRTTITQWISNDPPHSTSSVKTLVSDETVLYDKLKEMQFSHIDDNDNRLLDRNEVHKHLDPLGLDRHITDVLFDKIDRNGDGNISVMEWLQWKNKFKQSDLHQLIATIQPAAAPKTAYDKEQKQSETTQDSPQSPPKKDVPQADPPPSDDFTCQLNVVSSAVSKRFNARIGSYVHQIIEADYETSDEVCADLKDLDESDIIQMVKQHDEQWCNANIPHNTQRLCEFLRRIFRDNITNLALLVDDIELPNTLKECAVNHIQYIAMCVMQTVNKTAKRKTNVEHVKELIAAEDMNGQYMNDTSILDFISKARSKKIPAGKSRQLCRGIKDYKFPNTPHRIAQTIHSSQEDNDDDVLNWDGIAQIEDCKNAHIVCITDEYVLNEMNNPKLNAHRSKIIQCIKTNAFAGVELKAMDRRSFAKTLWEYCGDQQLMGDCCRLYKAVLKFDISRVAKQIGASNDDEKDRDNTTPSPTSEPATSLNWDSVSDLSDCTHQHLAHIVDKHVFDTLTFGKKELQDLFDENRHKIIECIQIKQIDGKQLHSKSLSRKQFASALCTHCACDTGPKKLNASCLKLYTAISKLDVASVVNMELNAAPLKDTRQKPPVPAINVNEDDHKGDPIPSNEPYHIDEIQHCNANEFVYLVEHYILSFIDNERLNKHNTQIVSYFEQQNLDGAHILQIERKKFLDALSEFCKDKKLRGAGVKLYNAIHGLKTKLDISSVSIPAHLRSQEGALVVQTVRTLEECSNEHIIYALRNHIFPDLKLCKLTEYKHQIMEYIKLNNINGKQIKATNEKDFATNVSLYLTDESQLAPLGKLFDRIVEFNYHMIPTCISPRKMPMPKSICECNAKTLVFIMKRDMIPKIPSLTPHALRIESYFTENNIDGKTFLDMKRTKFVNDVIASTGDKKTRSGASGLHTKIKNYKFGMTLPQTPTCDPNPTPPLAYNVPLVRLDRIQSPHPIQSDTSTSTLTPNASNSQASPSYDHITCDKLASMVKQRPSVSFTHKKIQKNMKTNSVNGTMFMDRFDVNDGDDFKTFFNQICGAKNAQQGRKFEEFRKWFIDQIKDENDQIKDKNVTEMMQFILNQYDEFVSHILTMEQVDGPTLMKRGSSKIANQLFEKFGIPRGDITHYCGFIEEELKADTYTNSETKSPPKPNQKSPRKSGNALPQIESFSVGIIEDDDLEHLDVLGEVIDALNNELSGNKRISKAKLIDCVKSKRLNRDRLNHMKRKEWMQMMKACEIETTTGVAIMYRVRVLLFKWNRKVSQLKDATNDELLYVLLKFVLPKQNVSTNKVIQYVKDQKITGALGKNEFVKGLKTQCDIKRGPATKIHSALNNHKWSKIKKARK